MPTCAECEHQELQCPPVIRCKIHGGFRYLDSPSCEDFKPVEIEESAEQAKKS